MKTIDMSKLNKKVKAITELNNKTIAKELLLSAYNNEWETTRKTLEICLTWVLVKMCGQPHNALYKVKAGGRNRTCADDKE